MIKLFDRLNKIIIKLILILILIIAGQQLLRKEGKFTVINPIGGYPVEVETLNQVKEVNQQIRRIDDYDLQGEFTAYNPTEDQTDSDPLTMASNKNVYDGAIACPSKYEFGQKVEIDGYGIFICEDRMHIRYDCFRADNCTGEEKLYFDILMFEEGKAKQFGRRQLKFRLLDI